MKNLFIKKLIFLLFISLNAAAQDGKFTFTISSPVTTSAGVFKDDSILVRTLWNDERYAAGTYTKYWDGKDDYGKPIVSPDPTYKIKVLTNNVKYAWQGTIGNTSDNMTGDSKHRGYYTCMRGLAFGSTYGYFCTGYSEGAPSFAKFNIATPNTKINILGAITSTCTVEYVATDGIRVYWGGMDAHADSISFVFGTNVSNDAYVTFSSGVSYAPQHRSAINVISKVTKVNSIITGLAVQKAGSYLFVARSGLNQLQVLNKTTGALVQTLTYSSPRGISVDGSDNLWMSTGLNTVKKYIVNGDGTLTSTGVSLGGLTVPTVTQVSPNGNTVAVLDTALSSQQVKFFSTSTGSAITTLGSAGGYTTDATVSNNKFYFYDYTDSAYYPRWQQFLAYQPDGSFWVNDPGNYRAQHYDAANNFINRIMSLGANYNVYADKNNPKKVFANGLEFEIDYSQPLTGSTGWVLKRNWAGSSTMRNYGGLSYINTLSNGRTYCISQKKIPANTMEVLEFDTMLGKIRPTGVYPLGIANVAAILCDDGSVLSYNLSGGTYYYFRYLLNGFNGSNNPVYSSVNDSLATAASNSIIGNPAVYPKSQIFSPTTNKIVLFNYKSYANNIGPVISKGYHLGLMQKGATNKYLFQTEKSTFKDYKGAYPKAGWYDVGNGVNDYGGGNVNIVDRNIITSYHGEFWKNGQTNKFNHYYDNGLAIGQFGTTRADVGIGAIAAAGMAGNALTATLVKDGLNNLYLWHGDEGDHSGIHMWKITQLNTIAEQVVTIPFPSSYALPVANYVDLMAGLPIAATLLNNTAGWTRNPLLEVSGAGTVFSARTTALQYDTLYYNDLLINYIHNSSNTSVVNRDLGNNNVTNSWKITGSLAYPGNMPNGNSIEQYFEVLDDAGKVLTTFYPAVNRSTGLADIWGNNLSIESGAQSRIQSAMDGMVPFTFSVVNGNATFGYGNYTPVTTSISDATGNWRRPKKLRIKFVNDGNNTINLSLYAVSIDLSDLKFYKDYLTSVPPNKLPVANAGKDTVITLPNSTINLSGSGIDPDGFVTIYKWARISGPSAGVITAVDDSSTTVTNLARGIYQYELTIQDSYGDIARDTVEITVNLKPSANAGVDKIVQLPSTSLNLTGTGTDPEGNVSTYSWRKISGPLSFTIANISAASTLISGLDAGVYKFELTVADNFGAVGRDTVQVIVNVPPVAYAGADKVFTLPVDSTKLIGGGSDLDGKVTGFLWTKITGPSTGIIVNSQSSTTSIKSLSRGLYKFKLTATDNNGGMGSDTVDVLVNGSPLANAGLNKLITLPVTSLTLTGSGTDPDGNALTYYWSKISGPSSGTLISPTSASTVLNTLMMGIYVYQLTVRDIYGATGRATVQITVNGLPTAKAGANQVISLPINYTVLSGIGTDPEGKIASYLWTKISGPATGTITIPTAPITNINSLVNGIYQFQFKVTDNYGATATSTVQITVNAPPFANAGLNQVLTIPTSKTVLAGSGTDIDGNIVRYKWTKISGPLSGWMSYSDNANCTVDGLSQGVYIYQLVVTDNFGSIGKDTMQVTVNAAPILTPLASAGTSKVITQPTSSVTLAGSASSPNGKIVSYAWTKLSGPGSYKFVAANAASTVVNGLAKGVYVFQLMVTDNRGAKATSKVQITVNAAPNKAPTANAGANKTISLPTNMVTLTGTGTDPDGTIRSFAWVKLSGPKGDLIGTANGANTTVNNLVAGIYQYQLTVTDNMGATAKSTMLVTVISAVPKPSSQSKSASSVIVTSNVYIVDSASTAKAIKTSGLIIPKFSYTNALKVFPNPAKDIVNLSITSGSKNDKLAISLFNSMGMLVHFKQMGVTAGITNHKLDVSHLASGMYFIIVRFDGGQEINYRLVKD